MNDISPVQTRLARYYLGRLRAANTIYRRGATSSAESTVLLGQEWAQIAQWQAWAAAQSPRNDEAAQLCASYAQDGADILITRQTPEERVEWLNAGLAAARAIGDSRAVAVCLLRLAWAIYKQTQLDRAEEIAGQALAQSKLLRDTLLAGQSLHLLGEIAVRRGVLEEAERLYLRSVTLLQSIDAQAALAEVYFNLSELAYFRGMPDRAHAYALQCHRINQALGLNLIANNSLTWLGLMTIEAGDFARGEEYVRQSEALCRASGAQSTLAHTLSALSQITIMRKDTAQARAYVEEGLQIARRNGEAWLIPFLLVHSGAIHVLTGEYDAARRDTSQAVELARTSGYRSTLIYALMDLAVVELAAGALPAASTALYEGLEMAVQAHNHRDIVYGVFVAIKLWYGGSNAARAAEWAELLLNTPGVDYPERRDLQSLRAELADVLGMEAFAAAVERSKTLDIDSVVEHIVSALAGTGHAPIE
jgi:tetratricopeptide (TPR) repeat protein